MKLWKDNRTDQEWELPNEEIITRFKKSYHWKNRTNYRGYDMALRHFISDRLNDGLNSVFEEYEIQNLFENKSYQDLLEID